MVNSLLKRLSQWPYPSRHLPRRRLGNMESLGKLVQSTEEQRDQIRHKAADNLMKNIRRNRIIY